MIPRFAAAVAAASAFALAVAIASAAAAQPQPASARTAQPTVAAASGIPAVPTASFVPIVPCRIVDTRAGGGKLAANATRSVYVSGTFGFAPQGGKTGGCGIPVAASGAAISLTSTSSSGAGRVVAYPAGSATPNSTLLSYRSGANVTSTPTVALRPGTDKQLTLKNYSTSTHLVIDVVGYYEPTMAALVQADGAAHDHSGRLVSVWHGSVGEYRLVWDRSTAGCVPFATSYSATGNVVAQAADDLLYVFTYASNGAASDSGFNVFLLC